MCAGCREELPPDAYSKTQLKKHGKRKCLRCLGTAPSGPARFDLASELRAIAAELNKLDEGNNTWEREAVAAFVDDTRAQPRLELTTITCPGQSSPLPDSLATLAASKEARRACEVMAPVFSRSNNCIVSSFPLFQGLLPWCRRHNVRCRMARAFIVPPFWVTFDSDATPGDTSMWAEAAQTEDGTKAFEHRLLHFTDGDTVVYLDPTASQAGFPNHACVFETKLPMPYSNLCIAEDVLPTAPVVNQMITQSLAVAHEKDRPWLLRYWKAISLLCARL